MYFNRSYKLAGIATCRLLYGPKVYVYLTIGCGNITGSLVRESAMVVVVSH